MKKRLTGEAAIGLVAILVVAGCGSGSSKPSSTQARVSPNVTVVSTALTHNPRLGAKILVNSTGFTLYAFSKDPRNTFHPHCNGSCISTWPPLILTGSIPVAGKGALSNQFGAIKRSDGKLQVDYAGFPLYTYAGDKKPGDALGNGVKSFGGSWHVLTAQGTPATR